MDYFSAKPFPRERDGKSFGIPSQKFNNQLVEMGVHTSMQGSNGEHYLLVANGWEGSIGGSTLAMGGEHDTPSLLVTQADGYGQGLRQEPDGTYVRADHLDPYTCDAVFYGNSEAVVEKLVEAFLNSLN